MRSTNMSHVSLQSGVEAFQPRAGGRQNNREAGGPDQLSPLLRFKTCLIGFPERPRRGKGELVTSPSVPVEGGGARWGGWGSLISHRWTPPVAINQSQSPAGARRGSTAGREREGGRAWSLEPRLGPPPTPSTDSFLLKSEGTLLHSSSFLTQIDLGPV
ncbi:unnamed protein product [Pleuronectes platessa]|uniref:Uncharacterized protein n=1 Tax=Pleuronectes platessa TaxID=8262 RepID=A0A9N7VWP9_PLEPL|nr:unnamed protein product [Pleuronectes platessa]